MSGTPGSPRPGGTPARPCTSGTRVWTATAEKASRCWLLRHPVSEPLESARVTTPVGEDFHPQVQVYGAADESFDLRAGSAAQVADPRTLLADQDPLLAIAFDVDRRPNVHR